MDPAVAVVVLVLQLVVKLCLAMSIMLFLEKLYIAAVVASVKIIRLLRKLPAARMYNGTSFHALRGHDHGDDRLHDHGDESGIMVDDLEANHHHPMVLVQIPMFNEKQVYELSIGAACGLSWPSDRLIVQVLDDSTDPAIKRLVKTECRRWESKGVNIKYEARENRNGYKAGNLKRGMKHSYVKQCEYVAIFDADFQPEPNFLRLTVPSLLRDPDIALVQSRWSFVNADECLMTRMQEMSLDYHFNIEQQAGSSTYAFFGFNGTAGVWRISALNEVGGWKDRTTVEDMDLAVRAGLKGWKFLYLGDVKVKNELPSTFKAYRNQQHRWSCGPANLFRKMGPQILTAKRVSVWKKFHLVYSFFLVRKIVSHLLTFSFYCIIMPATILLPEVHIPKWASVYLPTIVTLLHVVGTPTRSIHLVGFWVLFENVMSLHRTKAMLMGLLEFGRVNEWVVTEKLGDALRIDVATAKPKKKPRLEFHWAELGVAIYLFVCGCYDYAFGKNRYFIFLFMQSIAFFIAGCGYVGTFIPNS
ncbi:unnamed protein product [Linum tenue]|uniref:glucomannan 4-beta-mannosyltransferase n=1 Tax=Linum tenue TaxID=586396 RepID=A0AAV0M9G5_9ROSI|nr:unnamed protein product [Linum tenue]